MSKGEADYVTSSPGFIAFLLWHGIYPDDITDDGSCACVYRNRDVNWGELVNSYWLGERIPMCEISECIVVTNRILKNGEIDEEWYRELKEAIEEVRQDYIFV